jgi:hypothetical protein
MLQQNWGLLAKFQCICCQYTEFVVQLNWTIIICREPTGPGTFQVLPVSWIILLNEITSDISCFQITNFISSCLIPFPGAWFSPPVASHASGIYMGYNTIACPSGALVTHLWQAPHLLQRLLVPDIILAIVIKNIFLICYMLLIKLQNHH